jgi:Mrp family chromosome partitioning ATPase/capsular polysaccharide biosynthesis protein
MVAEYTKLHASHTSLVPGDATRTKLFDVLKSMDYDDGSLRSKLEVDRVKNSDFIDISFASENAAFSAFVANTVATEFINNYSDIVKGNRLKTSDWLYKLLMEKLAAWREKMETLKNYKIQNHILNLEEQAKAIYGQIADFETRRQVVEKDILGYTANLQRINSKFEAKDRKYLEGSVTRINEEILESKEQLHRLNDEYVKNGFDDAYKPRIDSLRRQLEKQINIASDKYIYNPLSAKTQLVSQKLQEELDLEMAQNSVVSVAREIERLNNKLYTLVPHEAMIQNYETDIDVASREYLEILNKWNEFNMEGQSSSKLKQAEVALPGAVLPSKKMLLIILSGVISFIFCVLVIFALFLLDHSVRDDQQLADRTGVVVLGRIKQVKGIGMDLRSIWNDADASKQALKKQLRALRFEIDDAMNGSKLLAVTSISGEEGKTFIAINLAYAWSMANKKVLLIDGNFANPAISNIVKPSLFVEDYFAGKVNAPVAEQGIAVLGNKGGDNSLMELTGKEMLESRMSELGQLFDIIVIDTAALENMDKAKEWIAFAQKTICVFETGNLLTDEGKQHVQYLNHQQQLIGWVLNKA